MTDTKISALTSATTPLAGTEVLPIVQSGTTQKVSVDNLTIGKLVSMDTLLVGTGDSNAGANFRKYGSAWTSASSTYPFPSGNIFGSIGYSVGAQDNWFGFIGGYGVSSGSVNILLQQNVNNTSQQAGNYIGSEATSAASADIVMGKMVAGATTGASATKTEQLRVYSSGDIKFNVGNLIQGTAAKGINFTANTPASGMTSQLLNWYEEGTWTPVIADAATGGNAGTAEFTFARYTRLGRKIFFNVNLVNINTSGLTAGNALFLRGLPFTAGNWCNGFSNMAAVTNFTYAGTMVNAEVYAGGTYIRFYDVKSATGATLLNVAAISSGSCNIYINGMYEV